MSLKQRKRIFVSFPMENEDKKNLFIGMARNNSVPYDFIDMSLKEPFDEKWKTQCRQRIRSCDGLITLISSYTRKADGQRWEIQCALHEEVPVLGVWIGRSRYQPPELKRHKPVVWKWEPIRRFLNKL